MGGAGAGGGHTVLEFHGDGLAVAFEGVRQPGFQPFVAACGNAHIGGERQVPAEWRLFHVEDLHVIGGEHAEERGGHPRLVVADAGDYGGHQPGLEFHGELFGCFGHGRYCAMFFAFRRNTAG